MKQYAANMADERQSKEAERICIHPGLERCQSGFGRERSLLKTLLILRLTHLQPLLKARKRTRTEPENAERGVEGGVVLRRSGAERPRFSVPGPRSRSSVHWLGPAKH